MALVAVIASWANVGNITESGVPELPSDGGFMEEWW
jgi:hypothetical protein